jgi:hypothetical protein
MVRTRKGAMIGPSSTRRTSQDTDYVEVYREAPIDDTTSYISSLSPQSRLGESYRIHVDVDSR